MIVRLRLRLAVLSMMALTAWAHETVGYAQATDTTLTLRPHCLSGYEADNRILESGGDEELLQCPEFSVEDPQTLKTPPLAVGDILDIDIVLENPTKAEVMRVRSWLSYDPNILRGDQIVLGEKFPTATPGESDFSPTEGYAKIEGSVGGNGPKDVQVLVARVQFSVVKSVPAGTVISFYDIQKDGHTSAVSGTGDQEKHILTRESGSLHVVIASENAVNPTPSAAATSSSATTPQSPPASSSAAAKPEAPATLLNDGDSCVTNTQCRTNRCSAGVCQSASVLGIVGTPCSSDAQCASGVCTNGSCSEKSTLPVEPTLLGMGSACTIDTQCQSGLCGSGVCIPPLPTKQAVSSASVVPTVAPSTNTAFSLLQVQSVRVTTEGGAIYLAWEPLHSSQLKGYNIYYGTTTGRYIQRKTVEGALNSLAIRSLPIGTSYYFAIRALNQADEESAFSQEVAVTVGDPKTSTAPLAPGTIPQDAGPGKNPIEGNLSGKANSVPGETGIPSVIFIAILLSAVIGTGFAYRRQMLAVTTIES